MTSLHDLSALEQAAAVRGRRDVRPLELVEHCAARIAAARRRPSARSSRSTLDTRPGAGARRPTRRSRRGEALPPLHGVPTAVKDLNLSAGVPTGFGSPVFDGFVPPVSDHVVDKLRAAGTISLGKTDDAGVRAALLHRARGRCRRPARRGT